MFALVVSRILREYPPGLQLGWLRLRQWTTPPARIALIFPFRLRRTIVAAATLFLLACAALTLDGLHDQIEPVDLLVVPGSQVHPDGTLSRNLLGRLEAAKTYFGTGNCRRILVSGGTGSEGIDESLAMRKFLLENGVPDSVIIVDGGGVNTFETARFAARWMREHDERTVAVASSFFHISRLRLALHRHGIRMAGHIHSRRREPRDLYSVAREVPGLVAYLFREP